MPKEENDLENLKEANQTEEKEEEVEEEPKERLKPHDTKEWTNERTGNEYTFIMPSAEEYRRNIATEKVGTSADGQSMDIDLGQVDPLIFPDAGMSDDCFVKPAPKQSEITPAQLQDIELAYFDFVKSIFR